MTDTQNQLGKATWEDAASGQFLKFEEGKRIKVAVKNWELNWVNEPSFEDKSILERKVKFTCDVVGLDGKQASAKIGSTSKRFMDAVRPHLKDAQGIVFLSIKKIGKDSATNFDVELLEPTVLV